MSIGGSDGIDGSNGGSVVSTFVSIAGRDLSIGGRETSTAENVESSAEVVVGAASASVGSGPCFGSSPGVLAGSAVSAIFLVV